MRKTLPRAIFLSLIISALLYFLVVTVAVLAVPPAQLAASETPIALIVASGSNMSPKIIAAITIFATVNGALIQIILAARVFYGLSNTGGLPKLFGGVNPVTQTPLISTVLVVLTVLVAGAIFPLEGLARFTSLLTLAIFALVNLALLRLETRNKAGRRFWRMIVLIPLIGTIVSVGFMLMDLVRFVCATSN